MGRVVSAVIGRALSNGSSARLTQTLRVPLNGLIKAMNLPSGDIWAPTISGSPKNSSRSIKGAWPFGCAETLQTASTPVKNTIEKSAKSLKLHFLKFIDYLLI